ncbi:hypothetical protein [Streptomyces lincolnensis]|uniref:hypothetical protein n=1 Tax=Streptomyces lincolnensis TaxID=1915 RepID=UPI00082AD46D|nr:hypothetical protein [Streptomyces lincolnensis]QMV07763.1 hypothetical protein GJU35_20205 [Streptomyces lincolnensis]
METRPQSPRPPGTPRWVALFHRPASDTWRVGAEAPDREPVLYALGEMAQTLRARGEDVTVDLWGPHDGAWQRYDIAAPTAQQAPRPAAPAAASAPVPGPGPAPAPAESTPLAERLHSRRHQALMAGLGKAGLYDLTAEDVAAVQTVVDRLDEATVRTLARWLAGAGQGR